MENNINPNFNNNNDNNNNINSDILKIIYGIIGGIQSFMHIISGFFDAFYLAKEFKIYVLENIFKGIKVMFRFLKYILTFQFINNKTTKLISNIITSFGTTLCLIILYLIKKEKENNLKIKANEEKNQLHEYLNLVD